MFSTIRTRLEKWLDRSVGNRIAMAGVAATSVMVLLFGLLAFSVLSYVTWNSFLKGVRGNLERIAESHEFRLHSVQHDLTSLSLNSFVINSLADSTGREVYLYPTLRDFRLSIGAPVRLALYDANIAPYASNERDYRGWAGLLRDLAAGAFKREQPEIIAQMVDGKQSLVMVFPIVYPPSATYEGVLLGVVEVDAIFHSPADYMSDGECLMLSSSAGLLGATQCDDEPSGQRFSHPLRASGQQSGVTDMELIYYVSWSPLLRQLGLSLFLYLLAGTATVGAAYLFSRHTGRQFSRQLADLSSASRAIAESPSVPARVEWGRPDEIGRFAEDFNTMVARLQEFQLSLEDRIRIRTRELVAARDEAQAASLAKSNFLASMSHELRTPMNAVLGFSQLIELEASGTQADHIREVMAAGHHMMLLIDEILDLARIEAGRLTINQERVELAPVLQECCSVIKPQLEPAELQLTVDDALPPGTLVMADRVRLKQVLINLLSNAIKYNRHGGSVKLRARLLSGGRVRVKVSDSGLGIDTARQQKLFEAFNRLGRESGSIKGTGIGLVISKKLVEMMDGEIGFESRPGEGSDFWVDLAVASDQ